MVATRLKTWLWYALVAVALATLALVVIVRLFRLDVTVDEVIVSARRVDRVDFPAPSGETIRHPSAHRSGRDAADQETPRNVILVLGDGMGLGHLATTSATVHGPAGGLAVELAPVIGLVRTWTASDLVTDSAAAGSAMATGLKTVNKVVSTQPNGHEPKTIFDGARSRGMATGFVTTSGLADGTPASFLAHSESRYEYAALLRQILRSDVDVLIGGTFENHLKAGSQPDYLDLLARAEEVAGAERQVVRAGSELAVATAPLVALFPPRPGRRYAHGPPLADSVGRTLELLSADPAGFLLVVESEETDEGSHDNSLDRMVEGLLELDAAIIRVLEFAGERGGDTLVLVTADHDTAGVAISNGSFETGVAEVRWMDDDHLATWVPLFAFGPGAGRFSGVLDNTEIGIRIAEVLGIAGFPSSS
jgi:alkaline phosphatase